MRENKRMPLPLLSEVPGDDLNRRAFFASVGVGVVLLTGSGESPPEVYAQRAAYPRQRLGLVSELRRDRPVLFRYPWDHPGCSCILLQLQEAAAGGVGPASNIVAFSRACTHMGRMLLAGDFNTTSGIALCRRHWTTFDLSRHGTIISGHATQALSQIQLEVVEDVIFAVALQCLLFGFHDNRVPPGK